MACIKAKSKVYEIVANIPVFLAAAMGGGCGDKPRWFNIFWIAVGFLIALMIFNSPSQCLHLLSKQQTFNQPNQHVKHMAYF